MESEKIKINGKNKVEELKILPPLEKWDSNNEYLYYYNPITFENGDGYIEEIRIPLPIPIGVFYRRRKIPSNMLNLEQFDNCKYCNRPLIDGYWRRMHECRLCHNEKRGTAKALFPVYCKKCNKELQKNDFWTSQLCEKCYYYSNYNDKYLEEMI